MPRGRKPGFRMGAEHRCKIKDSSILNELIKYATNDPTGKITEHNRAVIGLGLLKKVMPDLTHNEHANDPDNPITRPAHEYSDEELLARIAGMGSAATVETPPSKSKLN